jgi:putative hydrolase of the HAD superfamily
MINAILFDAAGTLIHLPQGVGWHYRHIAARHGIILEKTAMATAFAETFRTAAPRVQNGIPRPDDDKGWWRTLVRRALAACGHEPADAVFDPMFEDIYAHFAQPGVWELFPDAIPVLDALKGHYRLGIVSNFDRRLYPVLDHLGIRHYFDTIVLSSEAGIDKPDPRIFIAALSALGATPAETIHVGDDPRQDWQGAEAAGLHVFRVAHPKINLSPLPEYARTLIPRT